MSQIKNRMDYETDVAELKIAAYKVKAIADAFAHEWIDKVDNATIAMLENDPEPYQYLFTALHDALCEVCRRADELEDTRMQETV